ncbi:MAG TPA: hypothetical protein VE978_24795 [Chitinophagales bacterium]|nr:hypothetical protein [Chitinophagales bacterium]
MRKIFLTLILLICSRIILCAQSINDLDNNGGFKDFKIGDPKSKWQQYLGNPCSKIGNTYWYIGDCCRTAFGLPVTNIRLTFGFDDNKLQAIVVYFGDTMEMDKVLELLNHIKAAFGKPNAGGGDEKTGNMEMQWIGSKIVLTLIDTYHTGNPGGYETLICFMDEKMTIDPVHDY